MAHSVELCAAVSEITRRDPVSIQTLHKTLRVRGLIDTDGRGRHAKDATADDASCLLIADGCGTRSNRAAEETIDYWYRRAADSSVYLTEDLELKASFFRLEMIYLILSAESFGTAVAEMIRCVADDIAFKTTSVAPASKRHSPFIAVEFHRPVRHAKISLGNHGTPILSVDYNLPDPEDGIEDSPAAWDDYAERRGYAMSAIRKIAQVVGPTLANEPKAPFFAARLSTPTRPAPADDEPIGGFHP